MCEGLHTHTPTQTHTPDEATIMRALLCSLRCISELTAKCQTHHQVSGNAPQCVYTSNIHVHYARALYLRYIRTGAYVELCLPRLRILFIYLNEDIIMESKV